MAIHSHWHYQCKSWLLQCSNQEQKIYIEKVLIQNLDLNITDDFTFNKNILTGKKPQIKKKIIESVPWRLIHIKSSLEMKSLHTPSQEMTSTASACAAVEDLGLGGWWQCQDSLQWWILTVQEFCCHQSPSDQW